MRDLGGESPSDNCDLSRGMFSSVACNKKGFQKTAATSRGGKTPGHHPLPPPPRLLLPLLVPPLLLLLPSPSPSSSSSCSYCYSYSCFHYDYDYYHHHHHHQHRYSIISTPAVPYMVGRRSLKPQNEFILHEGSLEECMMTIMKPQPCAGRSAPLGLS